ncbi:hypothetical protein B0H12DRAFT_1153414 [Mycena haematopus]|nr:hypothetical protein B0H12DRAFT_1153414 [Mycena haematopus]
MHLKSTWHFVLQGCSVTSEVVAAWTRSSLLRKKHLNGPSKPRHLFRSIITRQVS